MIAIIQSIVFGIVEGITEWLPISSTGHMILLNSIWPMQVRSSFYDMYLVVIQLGAILAVVVTFWHQIWPFSTNKEEHYLRKDVWSMWFKVIVACIPAVIVGLKWDDAIEAHFYNFLCVAIMLIIIGVMFILAENHNAHTRPIVRSIDRLTYRAAFVIGMFQLVAAVFPGTSRSGATILGALLIGVDRKTAAEFTFYLAVPVMFGASLLKLAKYGFAFQGNELAVLIVGMVVAFIVSMLIIRFLMNYIKKHDFKVFGWYRIILGVIVLIYFKALA
ncbi:MAG: undecaprenyl-diphosphate phosphatase [Eubacterium sp.]|jgi:undecaprenyl-diphosphatase|nr:undecaprenyl-diphosphate phosphatase [Eubacterium sp.]MCI2197568.1 undecaprenyl-diphosphate phosphatase [Eubacterium sp.]